MVSFYIEYALYAMLFVLHCLNDRKSAAEHKTIGEKTYLLVKEQDDQNDTQDKQVSYTTHYKLY